MENPYQSSARSLREGNEMPLHLLKNLGLSAAAGGAAKLAYNATSKFIPAVSALINENVPEKFSKAGLSKISPTLGKFIQASLDSGYTYDDTRQFLGDKIKQTQQNSGSQQKNIIEQHSPDLHQFILEQIQSGKSPLEAGALATLDKKGGPKFKSIIEKITKQHKSPWASILETVYGGQQGQSQQSQQEQEPAQQQAQGQAQPQGGPGQQALMDILSKINQRMGQQ